jgi:hypothetical protein
MQFESVDNTLLSHLLVFLFLCNLFQLILALYRANAEETLKRVIVHISVKGIIDMIMTANNQQLTSTHNGTRESEDVPLVVTLTSSPSISRLRLSANFHPTENVAPSSSTTTSLSQSAKSDGGRLREVTPSFAPPLGSINKKKDKKMLRILQPIPQREVSYQLREATVSLLTDLYVLSLSLSFYILTSVRLFVFQCIVPRLTLFLQTVHRRMYSHLFLIYT